MASPPDRIPDPYDDVSLRHDPYAAPSRARPVSPYDDDVREPRARGVTAGPYHFGLREGVLGTLGIFAILGLVLGVIGFAAAFALDTAADELTDADGTNTPQDAAASVGLLPAVLVSLLPFMAAPLLAIGVGAWAGHASRDGSIGALSGSVGGLFGPIVTLLLTGIGFALGAGAANLDLSQVSTLGIGPAPGWGNTIPYLFTGAGLLWLLANTLAGGLTGGLIGGLLGPRWADRAVRRERHTRRTQRY